MRIEFSNTARLDLLFIHNYIAQENTSAARRTILRIRRSIRRLSTFPEPGRVWQDSDTRALSIPDLPYRVHYQISGSAVEILTVVHVRRKQPL